VEVILLWVILIFIGGMALYQLCITTLNNKSAKELLPAMLIVAAVVFLGILIRL